jgi:predicted PurR-regulated permease PerM
VNSSSSTLNTILISVIVVAALYLARHILIPIALAWILSFMLEPPVRILKNLGVACGIRVPRWLAIITVVLLAFAAIFALGGIMARQVTQLAGGLPDYQATASAKIQKLQALIPFPFELPEPRDYSVQMLNKLMSPLLGTFATSGIVIVFVIVSKRMTLVEKTRVHLLGWALRPFGGVVRLAIGLLWFVRPPHRAVVREEAADFAG